MEMVNDEDPASGTCTGGFAAVTWLTVMLIDRKPARGSRQLQPPGL
jgi:hypothetical protein